MGNWAEYFSGGMSLNLDSDGGGGFGKMTLFSTCLGMCNRHEVVKKSDSREKTGGGH